MIWKQLYESPWHHPATFIVANAAMLVSVVRSKGWMRAFLLVFTAEILLDATLTHSGSAVPAALKTPVAIAFVILGDARVLALLERIRAHDRTGSSDGGLSQGSPLSKLAAGIGLAFVVPVLQAIALLAAPAMFTRINATFLAYELIAIVAMTLYFSLRIRPALATASPALQRWARRIATFVLVQYALWSTADVLILSGLDAGYALRFVPNLLYYVAWLPFVWRSAPEELR